MRTLRPAVPLFACALLLSSPASARVLRVEVVSRGPVLNGKPFGAAGPYEKITARVHFAVRPDNPHNRAVVDLEYAPRGASGEVEFSADLFVLAPKDPGRGNGALLLEVPNRGNKGLMTLVNGGGRAADPTAETDFGDGWLLRQGYTYAVLGWQWDVPDDPGRLRLHAPVARNRDGSPITGLLRDDFTPSQKTQDIPLGHVINGELGGIEYPVADPADPRNTLTVRDGPTSPRRAIPRARWSFAHVAGGVLAASPRHLHLEPGFEPGKIYELVYAVQDPVVAGLGLAAVRDFASHVKYDRSIVRTRRVYAAGISQCGRFLRHFLWAGFNADESGRMALDGVLAHVAGAGRGSFNHRFAQPSRDAQPWSTFFYPTDLFPFTDLPDRDPVTRARAGLLDAAFADKVAPRIFYSNTSYEYWGRAAALIHVTPDGRRDAALPDNVRIYTFSGLQHFSRPLPAEPGTGDLKSRHRQNPNPVRWYWRAMITNMNAWVRDATPPPPSRHPRLSDGTLVSLPRLRFPRLPSIRLPRMPVRARRLDYGPAWSSKGTISRHPPTVGKPFPLLVPQVDADGNDRGGILLPELRVPLATYTGWNLRDPAIGAPDQMVSFLGSYLPFPRTAGDRKKTRDPRPSIAERYPSRDVYVQRFRAAAQELVTDRWLLAEDLPALLQRAEEEWTQAKPSVP